MYRPFSCYVRLTLGLSMFARSVSYSYVCHLIKTRGNASAAVKPTSPLIFTSRFRFDFSCGHFFVIDLLERFVFLKLRCSRGGVVSIVFDRCPVNWVRIRGQTHNVWCWVPAEMLKWHPLLPLLLLLPLICLSKKSSMAIGKGPKTGRKRDDRK